MKSELGRAMLLAEGLFARLEEANRSGNQKRIAEAHALYWAQVELTHRCFKRTLRRVEQKAIRLGWSGEDLEGAARRESQREHHTRVNN